MNCKQASLLSMCALLFLCGEALAEDDAKTRGTDIGTVISSAIDTALPGVTKLATSIVDIFKPKEAEKAKKKAEVDSAIVAATGEIKKTFKEKIKATAPLASQLDTLGPFLQWGFRASTEASNLLVAVSSTTLAVDSVDWRREIAPRWEKVKGALKEIKIEEADIKANVTSPQMQQLLLGFLEARAVLVPAIEAEIKQPNKPALLEDLASLNNSLSSLHVVARIQLSSIAGDVHALVAWASNVDQSDPQSAVELPAAIKTDVEAARAILFKAKTQTSQKQTRS